jgi:hypothetical protein
VAIERVAEALLASLLPNVQNQLACAGARSATPMTSILTELSALAAALVFTALMVVMLLEALDAHGRRR